MIVNIMGLGPRGLSVALEALSRGLTARAWDPRPLSSWSKDEVVPNLQMRSPISFDLCTNIEGADYSLCHYLQRERILGSQREIEAVQERCNRDVFEGYLQWALQRALSMGLEIGPLEEGPLVIATGQREQRVPDWTVGYDTHTLSHYLKNPARNKRLLVLGSGQGAAEAVAYLAQNNEVTWSHGGYRIDNYPAPSYAHWYNKTALGGYYRTLPLNKRAEYLSRVKSWGPSITPYIANELAQYNYKEMPRITNSKEIPGVDSIVLATGFYPSWPMNYPADPILVRFPLVKPGFRLIKNVYITGIGATAYDGPRQNSLISAGVTSREIVNAIIEDAIVR
ncbi:putative lysine/ornithine N-monooxygenase [Microcystis phage LMM01]|uniref:Lysine/ornithine N-monooxygenase n=1 Tax=Microcystis phage LMM01 TaxID=2856824 RepID=A0A7M0_9CAUD|nr:putative lysine/ornithine N-monooxygenase [Microcystis phage LMM01]BAF36197.1 putative lysine/ornithine N-monooxygenase [Microcystis phage LMM01]